MILTVPGLTYRHVPASEPTGKVLLVLHGRGDSMEGFNWLPGELALPGFDYMFVNAPDDYFGGYSWYDLPPNQAPGVLRSRALLFGALDALAEQGVDSRDVVLFGFSQGCLMSIDVGLRYGKPLGGICGVSGYMMFEERVAEEVQPHARRMPWLITHGTLDEVVPIGPTRGHVALMREAGVEVDWHEFPKDHTIEPTAEWPLIRRWMQARLAERSPSAEG